MSNTPSARSLLARSISVFLFAIATTEVGRADELAGLSRIDPRGIPGTIVLSGGSVVLPPAIDEFLNNVGRLPKTLPGDLSILVVHLGDGISPAVDVLTKAIAARGKPKTDTPDPKATPKAPSKTSPQKSTPTPTPTRKKSDLPAPKVHSIAWSKSAAQQAQQLELIGKSQTVWVSTANPSAAGESPHEKLVGELLAVQRRGGVVGGSGAIAEALGNSLQGIQVRRDDPNANHQVVEQADLTLADDAVLVVRGRRMVSVGDGNITLTLPASATRKIRKIVLDKRQPLADLTAIQRSLRNRLGDDYPPKKLASPMVAHGTLIIIG
ncbi:MAG: hypothetical protein O3A00_15570, partial [Planctomycetota bacterium]|nr:hypothetical protein [Planctomycetota bacterium]